MSSVDFKFLQSTGTPDNEFINGTSDDDYVYSYDNTQNRMTKISRDPFGVFIATFGQLGSGTSNYDFVQSMAVESAPDGKILEMDHMNHRIKEETKTDFSFMREYGTLGLSATSCYNPTGITFDNRAVYVGDDSNQRILKIS